MAELIDIGDITRVLRDARTIAVLGAHIEPARPACYVPDYLFGMGYRVLPVNSRLVGREAWGVPFLASLDEIEEPVDIVNVFRRSAAVPEHLEEIARMRPTPRLVWLQLGIRAPIAAALAALGIDLVQDRCTLADHRRLAIGPVGE